MFKKVRDYISKKRKSNEQYVSNFGIHYLFAFSIDSLILLIPRIVVLLSFSIYAEGERKKLFEVADALLKKEDKLASDYELYIKYFLNSQYAKIMVIGIIICLFIGFVYYCLMYYSSWHATIGNRFVNMKVEKLKKSDISISDVILKVALSYLLWVFPFFIFHFWKTNKAISVAFVFLVSFWNDASFLFGKKIGFQDYLSGTCFKKGKNKVKFKIKF